MDTNEISKSHWELLAELVAEIAPDAEIMDLTEDDLITETEQ